MQTVIFNPASPKVLHVDINSCFATIEQQANPFLRGKPIAVAAYDSPGGCILAPSIEAKTYGVKTGMRVFEGKKLCPALLVLRPDPNKYRFVHLGLRKILSAYTQNFLPKSIDEFVLDLKGYPCLREKTIKQVGQEIKKRVKEEIGDFISISVGIGPNRFLAKTASNLKKPDGLETIDKSNFLTVFSKLKITDLTGIKVGYGNRLHASGIYSVLDLYNAPLWKLKSALKSINSYYWYLRVRGWEIDSVDFARRSYGNSYSLPQAVVGLNQALPTLAKLTEKMTSRLRRAGLSASGVHLFLAFADHTFWHKGVTFSDQFFATSDVLRKVKFLFTMAPQKKIRKIAVSCFGLKSLKECQLKLFENVGRKITLFDAVDKVNDQNGSFALTCAQMINTDKLVPDRIAFGNVKELEEIVLVD